MNDNKPLVSILVPNFQHGKYLDQCLGSAFDQNYKNIEVILLDNCSTDDSLGVAKRYLDKGLHICKNVCNIFNRSYMLLSEVLSKGKYKMLLPADDYILPGFLEKCVSIMEKHPNVGYVHAERDFINDRGEIIELDPFYNCSFMAAGKDVMPVYMMTTVAHPAQGIFRSSAFKEIQGYHKFIDHANADKTLWYYLSMVSDYVYLREKLVRVRIGAQTETALTQMNFQHPLLMTLTILNFAAVAEEKGYKKVVARKQEALDKLALELLNACKVIVKKDPATVKKYLTFCKIISPGVVESSLYQKLNKILSCGQIESSDLEFLLDEGIKKNRSYSPPENYKILNYEEIEIGR